MEDIGHQVETRVTQGREIIQQVPTRSFETAQHIGVKYYLYPICSVFLVKRGNV
jgi:hypothetical protein